MFPLSRATWLLATALAVSAVATGETLEDAWRVALDSDQQLAAAQGRVAAAEADLAATRAGRYPTVTTGSTAIRFRDTPAFDFSTAGLPIALPLFDGRSVTIADAQVALPIYTGGALGASVAAALAVRTAEEQSQHAVRSGVKLGVATAYVGVLRADGALAAATSTAESLRAHVRDVDDRRRNGEVSNNDYLAAAVSLAAAEQRRLEAMNALELAHALYNRRLGRALDAPVAIDPLPAAPTGTYPTEPLSSLVSMALAGRPELAGLLASADAWTARASATAATRRPQLTVSGGYHYLENVVLHDRNYWSVALGVRWTPFDGGKVRHAADALALRATATTAERHDLSSAIELDVRRAWHAREAARARLSVGVAAVAQADENLRVVRDRYRNGEGTNTDVLAAEALRTQSVSDRDDALHDSTLADIELAHAIGSL